jgi:hypothetical protein
MEVMTVEATVVMVMVLESLIGSIATDSLSEIQEGEGGLLRQFIIQDIIMRLWMVSVGQALEEKCLI